MAENKADLLDNLKEKMDKADLPLKKGASRLVFGEGSPNAMIMFIGEGPGYWEDVKGRPFVGNAGALLNYALSQIGLQRRDVFITNVVHHRPPGNRDPLPNELSAYGQYLDKIIEIVSPRVIVTLGRYSMAKFIPGAFISSIHGNERKVDYKGREYVIIPMYHPAAALRAKDVKEKFLNDFKKISAILEKADEKESIDEKPEQLSII